jgi:hypothetical protein
MSAMREDLRWWLDLAPTLEWTWAVTYADSAPHWYVVEGRTPGMTHAEYVRAGRVIRTFGEPGKFWSYTNLYLHTEDRRLKFWCMWSWPPRDRDATLINLATTERTYGPQTGFDQARLDELRLPLPDDGHRALTCEFSETWMLCGPGDRSPGNGCTGHVKGSHNRSTDVF